MLRLLEMIRSVARAEVERVLRLQLQPRLGNVVAYDPTMHAAKIKVQPEGKTTNWIPVASQWIGDGWGLIATLTVGEQVKVVFPEYGANQGVVVGRLFDQRNPPPQGAQSGELWLVQKSGTMIKLTNDGKLSLAGHAELDLSSPQIVNITAMAGAVNITSTDSNVVVRALSGKIQLLAEPSQITANGNVLG